MPNIENRTIYCSDNLPVLREIDSNSIDLIYLDPPFAKNETFVGSNKKIEEIKMWFVDLQQRQNIFKDENFDEVFRDTPMIEDVFGENDIQREHYSQIDTYNHELIAYFDSIRTSAKKGIFYYLIFMTIRLIEMHRILKDSGSVYLHCDPTASHYLKVILDKIFGHNNFRNEIVWGYKTGGTPSISGAFARKHDTILFYSKGANFFSAIKQKSYVQTLPEPHTESGKQLAVQRDAIGKYRMVTMRDWWINSGVDSEYDIKALYRNDQERTGYPTQKPLALLERIINASSNEGDMVLDPFCGCATTCIAAEKLGRQWIGIDKSKIAYYMVYWRAHNEGIGTKAQPDLFGRNIRLVDTPEEFPVRTDKERTLFYEVKSRSELKKKVTRTMSPEYKKEAIDFLYEEQAGICNGCDQYMRKVDLTIDHIVPFSHEPNNDIDNLQLLCYRCNNWKRQGDMTQLVQTLYDRNVISVGTAEKQMKRYLGELDKKLPEN